MAFELIIAVALAQRKWSRMRAANVKHRVCLCVIWAIDFNVHYVYIHRYGDGAHGI